MEFSINPERKISLSIIGDMCLKDKELLVKHQCFFLSFFIVQSHKRDEIFENESRSEEETMRSKEEEGRRNYRREKRRERKNGEDSLVYPEGLR